jgi:uncharacterized membrane protein HdeD (DUF308 family)
MAKLLAKRWWVLLVRGLAAVLFGVIALSGPSVETLVLTFVAFALVDGIADVINSILNRNEGERWWLAVLRGVAGVVPGVLVLVRPQLGALRLLYTIAARALVTGILDIIKAIRMRKEIEGEWLLILVGLASVLFGLIAFARSGAGAPAVMPLIAGHALFVGVVLMLLAFQVRGRGSQP